MFLFLSISYYRTCFPCFLFSYRSLDSSEFAREYLNAPRITIATQTQKIERFARAGNTRDTALSKLPKSSNGFRRRAIFLRLASNRKRTDIDEKSIELSRGSSLVWSRRLDHESTEMGHREEKRLVPFRSSSNEISRSARIPLSDHRRSRRDEP